jgi:hypothetical protein
MGRRGRFIPGAAQHAKCIAPQVSAASEGQANDMPPQGLLTLRMHDGKSRPGTNIMLPLQGQHGTQGMQQHLSAHLNFPVHTDDIGPHMPDTIKPGTGVTYPSYPSQPALHAMHAIAPLHLRSPMRLFTVGPHSPDKGEPGTDGGHGIHMADMACNCVQLSALRSVRVHTDSHRPHLPASSRHTPD